MTPVKDPAILKEFIYVTIGFIGAFISILYGLLNNKAYTLTSSIIMILIGGFVGWSMGVATGSNLMSAIGGAMSLEIMHIVKENGPEVIKQKMKDFFNIK